MGPNRPTTQCRNARRRPRWLQAVTVEKKRWSSRSFRRAKAHSVRTWYRSRSISFTVRWFGPSSTRSQRRSRERMEPVRYRARRSARGPGRLTWRHAITLDADGPVPFVGGRFAVRTAADTGAGTATRDYRWAWPDLSSASRVSAPSTSRPAVTLFGRAAAGGAATVPRGPTPTTNANSPRANHPKSTDASPETTDLGSGLPAPQHRHPTLRDQLRQVGPGGHPGTTRNPA